VSSDPKNLEQLCINTIRGLAIDGVQQANSGHPGMPMGTAAMAYALWTKHLNHNPKDPFPFVGGTRLDAALLAPSLDGLRPAA
jgi:transketolase